MTKDELSVEIESLESSEKKTACTYKRLGKLYNARAELIKIELANAKELLAKLNNLC